MDAPERDNRFWIAVPLFLVAAFIAGCVAETTGYALYGSADAYVADKMANECQVAKERASQYAQALVHLLNQQTVVIGETTRVSCRVKEQS